jgi:hypothetical protein
VAQPGSALRSGRRGPQFKSGHPDQKGPVSRAFRLAGCRVRQPRVTRVVRVPDLDVSVGQFGCSGSVWVMKPGLSEVDYRALPGAPFLEGRARADDGPVLLGERLGGRRLLTRRRRGRTRRAGLPPNHPPAPPAEPGVIRVVRAPAERPLTRWLRRLRCHATTLHVRRTSTTDDYVEQKPPAELVERY